MRNGPQRKIVLSESDIRRFWTKIGQITAHGSCWEWTGTKYSDGYGAFGIGSQNYRAHRVSFLLHGGVTTRKKPFVLHSCHNPLCVNPQHLRAGDQQDNRDDTVKAGRQAKGERGSGAKLTESQVVEIRSIKGLSLSQIAHLYGIGILCVQRIVKRRTWTHI